MLNSNAFIICSFTARRAANGWPYRFTIRKLSISTLRYTNRIHDVSASVANSHWESELTGGLRHHDKRGDVCRVSCYCAAELPFRDVETAGRRFYALSALMSNRCWWGEFIAGRDDPVGFRSGDGEFQHRPHVTS